MKDLIRTTLLIVAIYSGAIALNSHGYDNTLHTINISNNTILYDYVNQIYVTSSVSMMYSRGIKLIFNRKEDAQAVIDNPNFREILDMVYKN